MNEKDDDITRLSIVSEPAKTGRVSTSRMVKKLKRVEICIIRGLTENVRRFRQGDCERQMMINDETLNEYLLPILSAETYHTPRRHEDNTKQPGFEI